MKIQLAENMRHLRKENHMTQEELAEKLNVSIGVVSKWERGASEPELTSLMAMAEVFKVSVDAIIGYNMLDEGPRELVKRITSLEGERKLDEAIEVADEALIKYPNSFEVVYASAKIYELRGYVSKEGSDYSGKAVSLYNKALTLISQDKEKKHSEAEIKNSIAGCLLQQGKVDEAIEAYKANNIEGINDDLLGNIYVNRKKNYEEGMEYLASCAATLIGKFIRVACGFANVYAYTEKYDMATKCCDMFDAISKAVTVDKNIPTFFDKVNALVQAGTASWYMKLSDEKTARMYMQKAYDIAKKFDEAPDYSVDNFIGARDIKTKGTAFDDVGPTAMAAVEYMLTDKENRAGLPLWKEIVKKNENQNINKGILQK